MRPSTLDPVCGGLGVLARLPVTADGAEITPLPDLTDHHSPLSASPFLDPPSSLGNYYRGLCSLAAKRGLQKEVCSVRGISGDRATWTVLSAFMNVGALLKQPNYTSYSFANLSLQEFFAAMSSVLSYEEDKDNRENFKIVEKLLEVCGRRDLFEAPTMRFLFGLLSEQRMDEMEKIFACRLPRKRRSELLRRVLEEAQTQHSSSPGLLHSLYEIQDKESTLCMRFKTRAPDTGGAQFSGNRGHMQTDMTQPVSTQM